MENVNNGKSYYLVIRKTDGFLVDVVNAIPSTEEIRRLNSYHEVERAEAAANAYSLELDGRCVSAEF